MYELGGSLVMMTPLMQVFLFFFWLNSLIQHLPHDVAFATQYNYQLSAHSLRLTVKHLFREFRLE
jgi:hypothetical protein